jgi:hypothetical protein
MKTDKETSKSKSCGCRINSGAACASNDHSDSGGQNTADDKRHPIPQMVAETNNRLFGKKMLVLGHAISTMDILKYARQNGIYTIVTDYLEDTEEKRAADETLNVNPADVDTLIAFVKERKIDAVFFGASEFLQERAMAICQATGLQFFATKEQWDTIQIKSRFKQLCRDYGVPVIKEYSIKGDLNDDDLDRVTFPVLVKPVRACAAKGISICWNKAELIEGYKKALRTNLPGFDQVIVEEYVQNMFDTNVYYTMQDGRLSLSAMCDRYLTYELGNLAPLPIGYIYPSRHLDVYIKNVNSNVINMYKSIGANNGLFDISGYTDGRRFQFYEGSFKLWGSQTQIMIEHNNGLNPFRKMIDYSLTGSMGECAPSGQDTPFFQKICCTMLFPIKPGTISRVEGLTSISSMPEVINVTQLYNIGDKVEFTGTLHQLFLRIYICASNKQSLYEVVKKINNILKIISADGADMRMKWFDHEIILHNY